jgi:hypothetical protein
VVIEIALRTQAVAMVRMLRRTAAHTGIVLQTPTAHRSILSGLRHEVCW